MVSYFISGKMWGHEHFELEDGPDIVSFSKKMLSGGIFHKESHRPKHPGRIINTWLERIVPQMFTGGGYNHRDNQGAEKCFLKIQLLLNRYIPYPKISWQLQGW